MRRRIHGQNSLAEHNAYFQKQVQSTAEFWRRFGQRPNFRDLTVLDLGCGHGAMSVDAARAGATVLGVDLDAERIEFSTANVQEHYPELASRLRFREVDLVAAPEPELKEHFDVVLSKDTFEHVEDVEAMLTAIHHLLKPDGQLWAGFSPLYSSPDGDHGRTGLRLPWAHAIMPRSRVLKAASRFNERPVERLDDIGLNGMTSAEFFRYAQNAGLYVESALFNQGGKRFMGVFSQVRKIQVLEPYFTIGIYSVMRRPA
jgi:SAM-dependent methyltransferase